MLPTQTTSTYVEGYSVTSEGQVLGLPNKDGERKVLKTFTDDRGNVSVTIKGKTHRVSRLVYFGFFPDVDRSLIVIHKNGNKSDNNLLNLIHLHREYAKYFLGLLNE